MKYGFPPLTRHADNFNQILIICFTDGQCLTVRCDSWQYARHECEVTGLTSNSLLYSMTLLKQYSPISDGECTDGYSFGYNTTGVWVDEGCRADFTVCLIPGNCVFLRRQ